MRVWLFFWVSFQESARLPCINPPFLCDRWVEITSQDKNLGDRTERSPTKCWPVDIILSSRSDTLSLGRDIHPLFFYTFYLDTYFFEEAP